MDPIPYGQGFLRTTTLLDGADTPAGLVFESGATLSAGDFKIVTDAVPIANLSAKSFAFTSGGITVPKVGNTLTGATSGKTMVVIGWYLTGGSWDAGTAAGQLFVEQVSGTFQPENLNNTTQSSTNDLTIGGDVTGAAFVMVGVTVWYAVTSTEAKCRGGRVVWQDGDGTVFQSDAWEFATMGHASAMFPDSASSLEQIILNLENIDAATVQAAAEAAIRSAMGVISSTVAVDAANGADEFTVSYDVGDVMLEGILKFTDGNLAPEGKFVRWTHYTVTVIKTDSVPAGLEEIATFSAEPNEGSGFDFWSV